MTFPPPRPDFNTGRGNTLLDLRGRRAQNASTHIPATGRSVGAKLTRRLANGPGFPPQISLTFPDGNARDFAAGVTPPAEVASGISNSLAKKAISATVNGQHWDLQWPIEADAKIAIHTMKDADQALELIRHDCAHIMARAVQEIWPDVKVTIGPVIENGFYYDFDREEPFTPEDLGQIEAKMKEIINRRDPVTTELWERDRAVAYYEASNEPYKVELVGMIPPEGQPIRMYWHGHWQDLCRGPHFQHTGQVPADAFKLMSVAGGAYWRGDSDRPMLQRIYGVAFQNKNELKKHLLMLEEAAKRDHRKLGREMDLFHMQEEAPPGQIFWHPNGWTIYTQLQDYMRRAQTKGGYVEVNTPQVVDRKLWEASGHWDKYQEHMFIVEVDEEHAREKSVNALKPMNCPPCHVQIFNQGLKSYRDLPPLRMAEFGSCNRYEPRVPCTALCACAALPRMMRISSAPRIRSKRKPSSSSNSCPRSTRTWLCRVQGALLGPAGKTRRCRRGLGQIRKRPSGRHPCRRDRTGP